MNYPPLRRAIVGIDFDDTIVKAGKYPEIGYVFNDAKNVINHLRFLNFFIIIHTCRSGFEVTAAYNFLDSIGVEYDTINNPMPWDELKMFSAPKIFFDIGIDDKNLHGLPMDSTGHVDWLEIYDLVHQAARQRNLYGKTCETLLSAGLIRHLDNKIKPSKVMDCFMEYNIKKNLAILSSDCEVGAGDADAVRFLTESGLIEYSVAEATLEYIMFRREHFGTFLEGIYTVFKKYISDRKAAVNVTI